MAACIQPDLHLEKFFAPYSRQTVASRRFLSMGFMREGGWTPSVLEATQAKGASFSGPTMVLSETRGLALFWVMRGGMRVHLEARC